MAKVLITTIQANLCCLLQVSLEFDTNFNSPESSLLKFLLYINLPSQPFLGCHLGFHIFFTMAFLGAAQFFTAWLFLD